MTTQYIGARYVPRFMGEWNNQTQYGALDVVLFTDGNSYTAKCVPPKGTEPTNSNYWALSGNFNQQIASMYDDINNIYSENAVAKNNLYLTDYEYSKTNTFDLLQFVNYANSLGKVALLTKSYTLLNNVVFTGSVFLELEAGVSIDSVSFYCDFRNCSYLWLKNVNGTANFYYHFYGADERKYEQKRNVTLIDCTDSTINSKLGLTIPKPKNGYRDNTQADYRTYGIEVTNFSGFNAVMITNLSVDDEGNIIQGASDNSAVGITDKVTGVAAPSILVDGGKRHLLRYVNSDDNKQNLLDISADGRIAIGCNTDASDTSIQGISALKVFYPTPIVSIKDSLTNKLAQIYLSGNNFNLMFEDSAILQGNKNDGYSLATLKNGVNNGVKFKNGQIFVNSDNRLSAAYYNYVDNETKAHLIQLAYSGASSNRPTNLKNDDQSIGFMFFDKTLGLPIFWNGTKWIKADGTDA